MTLEQQQGWITATCVVPAILILLLLVELAFSTALSPLAYFITLPLVAVVNGMGFLLLQDYLKRRWS